MSDTAGRNPCYEVSVEAEFCAAHALIIAGTREPVHGHNWRVTITIAGDRLDADGLLVDFHALERHAAEVLGPFHNADLNVTPPFDRLNPSAELVARHIAESIQARLATHQAGSPHSEQSKSPLYWVSAVRVTEAPGCSVVYRPTRPAQPGG